MVSVEKLHMNLTFAIHIFFSALFHDFFFSVFGFDQFTHDMRRYGYLGIE